MNMATSPPDLDGQPLELLIKIMRMTEAEDNIALTAIRRANSHLKKLNTDWEAVLRGKVKIIADPFASINIPASAMNPNRNQDYTPPPPRRPNPPSPQPTYKAPPPRSQPSPVRPKAGAPHFAADTEEKRIVNKHPGTCTKCKNRVDSGDGLAVLWKRANGTTYWTSEHVGTCPPTRKFRPATTSDDFQI